MRRRLILALAALCVTGGALPLLPARPADAYMLECCPFDPNAAPNLTMAVWAQHSIDTASWFENAVAAGVAAWNNTPTSVVIALQYTTSTSEQIAFWTDQASSSTPGPSSGGCMNTNSRNQCTLAFTDFVEGCYSSCDMGSGYPNYDKATVAHEVGHALGLDHSCTANTLMAGPNSSCGNGGAKYACSSESNCITTPQQDDINGVVHLYGDSSPQSGEGGGCAGTAPLRVPAASAPNIGPVGLPTPPVLSLPELPTNLIDGTEQTALGDAADPSGTAINTANDGLATTGKAVPWSKLPSPGTIHLPGGVSVNRPC